MSSLQDSDAALTEVDHLIVGAGPAGASLACFLASHGVKGLIVSSASSTSDTPRAHITNMAALECLRDIGLEKEAMKLGHGGDSMKHTLWCRSMTGEELARVHSWGHGPQRLGDYELASPCAMIDLPQTLLEPLLVRYATQHGFNLRWNTSFVSHVRAPKSGLITSTVEDVLLKQRFKIRSKYLYAADGARSNILLELDIPLIKKPGGGTALNVLAKVDLQHSVQYRQGNLHFILQPDHPHPVFGWLTIARMVKPWTEWMFIVFPPPEYVFDETAPLEDYRLHVQNLVGDPSLPVKILNVSKWAINEIVATEYSKDNVFCLGDAVHRHPPMNGLGSNTCIQDAYNLAWKIAYVEKGLAAPALLATYTQERQPVGAAIVTRANEAYTQGYRVWEALGLTSPDSATAPNLTANLQASTPAGRDFRAAFQRAVDGTRREFHGLGIEMGQHYASTAIIASGAPPATPDPVLHYVPSTVPGTRLPHAWLNQPVPRVPVSTHDIAGGGAFCLFTGHGGQAWVEAAARCAGGELGVPVRACAIGHGLDWTDVYFDWGRVRGVQEDGCVLVRPDRVVAWRCEAAPGADECVRLLFGVLRRVLGRGEA